MYIVPHTSPLSSSSRTCNLIGEPLQCLPGSGKYTQAIPSPFWIKYGALIEENVGIKFRKFANQHWCVSNFLFESSACPSEKDTTHPSLQQRPVQTEPK